MFLDEKSGRVMNDSPSAFSWHPYFSFSATLEKARKHVIFDPNTFEATDPQVIAVRSSYAKTPAKTPELVDCAFTSGIVKRPDGLVTLYSGLSDCAEGYVVIPNPFGDLL